MGFFMYSADIILPHRRPFNSPDGILPARGVPAKSWLLSIPLMGFRMRRSPVRQAYINLSIPLMGFPHGPGEAPHPALRRLSIPLMGF